ncbi:MAG: hypothetical protein ACTS6J_05930, partial [Burkholderiales bacterium]
VRYLTEYPRVLWFDEDMARHQAAIDAALPGNRKEKRSFRPLLRVSKRCGSAQYADAYKVFLLSVSLRLQARHPGVSGLFFQARACRSLADAAHNADNSPTP